MIKRKRIKRLFFAELDITCFNFYLKTKMQLKWHKNNISKASYKSSNYKK